LVTELNGKKFPQIILAGLEKSASEVSAFSSTSIEGNPLPLTEVKKLLKSTPSQARDSEKEVLNYNKALLSLNKKIENADTEISLKLLLNIHKQVVKNLLPDFDVGKLRKKPVVVSDPKNGQILYLPPNFEDVESLINDLLTFIKTRDTKVDPLILAGIFHKQMVVIHPFMDGNGRTTRLATKILLAKMGLNTFNLFSFENYYNKNVTRYFTTVGERGDYYDIAEKIDFTNWLEYFTEGIIDELLRVGKVLFERKETPGSELKEHHNKILEFIQTKGYIQDKDYAPLTNRAKATRALDFKKLIELGKIKRRGKGRATFYILNQSNP